MTTRSNKRAPFRKDDDAHLTTTKALDDSAASASPPDEGEVDAVERWRRIAEAAYYRAERRGFCPGCEMDDWLAAEREVGEQPDVAARSGGTAGGPSVG